MLCRLLVAFFLITSATGACAAKVTMTSPVSVKAVGTVALGDMASITGADKAEVEKLAKVPVTSAPIPGSSRKIDLGYIKLRIKSACGDISKIRIESPETVILAARSMTLAGKDMACAAREYTLAQLPQDGRRYEVEAIRTPADLVLPEGKLEMKLQTSTSLTVTGPRSAVVTVMVDERQCSRINVFLEVKAFAEVLVAKSAIPQKGAVGETNTAWEIRDVTRVQSPVVKGSDVSNCVAARSIASGTVITSDMLASPSIIETGSAVTILVKGSSLKLSAQGTALQDGRVGQTISVKGPSGNTQLRAVVVEPGLVEVRI